ncbi:phosphomevalonate kinase [Virgibacillus sp. MG-45]|uniref:phosphomevalonate kinase n=1 Tax=Virgibacillus sp. MG-45 TaxID=3102791 RepID=UPI002EDA07FE
MPNSPFRVRVPGKLMIAGEFAVLEPYKKLIVMAVDRFVYASYAPSEINQLSLENFNMTNLDWEYANKKVTIDSSDPRVRFVEDAMSIACEYLQEQAIPMNSFSLTIKSELDDASGKKYGLGSSAAVVTAVIAAILQAYLPDKPPKMLLFKLAAISHVRTQGNGSGADVAASAYGGVLQYASFQASWLKEAYQYAESLVEFVEEDWPYLSIKPVRFPHRLSFCIGWTGKPASTGRLVEKVLRLKQDNPTQYQTFLDESEAAVSAIIDGMEKNNLATFLKGVKQNRHALATVGLHANVELETPLLSRLCTLTEAHGGAGKLSGAGGGDCGIAFIPSEKNTEQLFDAWKEAGITPLDIKMFPHGAAINE